MLDKSFLLFYFTLGGEDVQQGDIAQPKAKNVGWNLAVPDIVDGLEDEILVVDTGYRIRFANSALRRKVPKKAASPVGKICYEVLQARNSPCSAPLWGCPLRKVIDTGSTTALTHPIRILGNETYLKITAYPLRDGKGKIKGVVELRRDVTAEKELESQILRRHHQLLALSHVSSALSGQREVDAILHIALDNVLEMVNGTVGGILLLDEATNQLYYRAVHGLSSKYADHMRLSLGEGIAGKVAQTGESILLEDISKDQRAAHSDLVSAEGLKSFVSIPLKVKDRVVGVMNIASHVVGKFGQDDVSLLNSIADYLGASIEQARLYERLAKAAERYQVLLRHALTAQEQERKRIARELHDETSQALTSLALSLQALIEMAVIKGIKDIEFVDRLKTVQSYAVHAGTEIVRIMKELRPTLLDELGLPSAIHRYAKDALQPQGIKLRAEFEGTENRLPPEIEVMLFRATQGLVGNIAEHSGAKNASINLKCDSEKCVLLIADDGNGFDVSKLTQVEPSGRGVGLFTIKERVRLFGGECHIDSKPRRGARITLTVPLTMDGTGEENKSVNSR